MNRLAFALCAAPAALLAAACSSARSGETPTPPPAASASAPASAAVPSCDPARAHAAGNFHESLASGGLQRTYILHVPPGYDGTKAAPLVLAYHGWTMTAAQFAAYDGFDARADSAGFVVVTPDGTGDPQAWNASKSQNAPDDVQFTKDLLGRLRGQLCIDDDRVYVAGFSLGGGMALRVACEMPDVIAAAAVVAALYPNCTAGVPLVAFHGSADPIVPFEGGQTAATGTFNFPLVRRSVSEWARALGCDGLPIISRPSSEVELSTFQRCTYETGDALLYTIIGGGHAWPGAAVTLPENVVGHTTSQIDATAAIWDFFAAHPRAH